MLKVLYQELSLKMFIGISTYFGVAWDRLELCGVYFSKPQEGLIRESLQCEIYARIGWIPVTKVVASKYYMSTVTCIGSVSQIMTWYISIDINKASPWIFYIMDSQENLELYPFWEKTSFLKCTYYSHSIDILMCLYVKRGVVWLLC